MWLDASIAIESHSIKRSDGISPWVTFMNLNKQTLHVCELPLVFHLIQPEQLCRSSTDAMGHDREVQGCAGTINPWYIDIH